MKRRNAILTIGLLLSFFVITFLFTRNLGVVEKSDTGGIVLLSPKSESIIANPVSVSGRIDSSWLEDGMPNIFLTNWDGLIISEIVARKDGQVDGKGFQSFKADLRYEKPEYNERGFLIVQRANPTKDPKKAEALEIAVYFK